MSSKLIDKSSDEFDYTDEKLAIELGKSRKGKVTQFIKKNFIKDFHYQEIHAGRTNKDGTKQSGGQNRKVLILTEETFKLVKNSYGLKNRYMSNVKNLVRTILPLETQTLGFIENCFSGILPMTREKFFGSYRVDLFIHDHKIVVECDEFGHDDRCPIYEKQREDYLKSLGLQIVRFNPNSANFDLSNVIRQINTIINVNIFKQATPGSVT